MFISTDRPTGIVWSIDSTNHNAAFVTSSTYLNDGKVATPCRMTWDVGTQHPFTTVTITGTCSFTFPAGAMVAFAVLFPKTPYAIPPGSLVTIHYTDGVTTKSGAALTTLRNDGSIVAIGFTLNTGSTLNVTSMNVVFKNDTSWAASGQIFDVGEIWFGTTQEFKTTADPQLGLVDNVTNRRSHNNTNQPLYGKPYRTLITDFTPMSNAAAYTGANNFDQVRYVLATAPAALVLLRIYTPGTTTQNAVDINQLTIFGRPDSIDPLKGVKDANGLWTARMTFSEAPP